MIPKAKRAGQEWYTTQFARSFLFLVRHSSEKVARSNRPITRACYCAKETKVASHLIASETFEKEIKLVWSRWRICTGNKDVPISFLMPPLCFPLVHNNSCTRKRKRTIVSIRTFSLLIFQFLPCNLLVVVIANMRVH